MKLSEAKVLDGDVLLFEGRSWYQRGIQLQDRSRFSHAERVVWLRTFGAEFEPYAIGAIRGMGVRPYPLQRLLLESQAAGERVYLFRLVDGEGIDRIHLARSAIAQLGTPYPRLWSFSAAFGWLGRRLSRRFELPEDLQPSEVHCSESVAIDFRRCGYRGWPSKPPSRTSPGDLALFTCLRPAGVLEPDAETGRHLIEGDD